MADTAVALFDWKADKPEAIDLKRGQVITLSDKSGNWWKGTVDGKTGKFPSNFVSLTKDAIKSVATFNYEKADDPTHLKFKKGDSIEVFKKDNTGWWVGRTANGAVGTFPANHVQEGAGVKKPKDEGSSRSSSSRSRSPSSRSNSASRSASGSQSRSRSPSSRSGSSRSRSSSRSPSDRSVSSRSGSSRSGSSRSRSGSASRSVSSRSASSAGDKKAAPAKAAAAAPVKEEPKAAPAKAAPAAPAAIEAKARSAPAEEAAVKPAAAAAAAPASAVIAKPAPAPAPAVEVKKEEPKKEEAKPAPAKPAPAKPANDSASDRSESSASRKSNSSKSKSSKSKSSQSKSNSDKSASEKSVSKSSSAKENKKAAAAPAPAPAKAAAAAPAEEKKVEEKKEPPKVEAKPAPAPAAKPAAPKEAPKASDKKSESSRSHSPSDRSRSPSPSDRSRSPSPSSRSSPRRRSESPSPKKTSGKHKERIETSARHRDDGSRSDRSGSGSERSSFVEGFHPAIKIPDAQDKDDLRVLLMINESQDAVKVRHALEGIQDIIHLDKSGLIAKKSGAIVALSKKVQSLISGGRPKVVKKDLDTCLDLLHQLVLDDFLAANDANDTGLINPLVALAASPEAAEDTKLRARKVLIALTAEENLKTCDSIVHSGHLLTLANQFAEGRDDARRDIGVILSRVLRVSGRMAQNALRQFHAFTGIVQALNSTDEHIQEAAAGVALWAVKDSGLCKNRFRIAHGLLPLARLLSSENAKVALQAAAATMELSAHNSENAKHFAKGTSAIPNLVTALRQHSLSHEGVVNVPLVHNVCGATWNIIRDRQYRVLAFLDEGIISPLIPLVERDNGPAHVLACKLQRKAPEMVQAHFYLSMEERWIKYQLAMQDYVRKHEAAVLADYRGEPIPMGVLDDQVKYDPYFTHHDHDPNVHRHAPRIPALHQFVAAGFNGPDVHVDPLVSGAPNGLRMHHTLAVPAASMPQQPPAFNGGAKISGIFMSKKVFKSAPSSANKPSRRIDVPAN